MKVLIVKSSYRKGSNSSALADSIGRGAKSAGANVQTIDIGRLTINNCRGCYGCLAPNNKDFCVIKDDMHQFYKPVSEADVIVFATPVYWFNVGGQIKQFTDRLFAAAMIMDENDQSVFSHKKFAAAFAYEDIDPVKSGCVNAIRMFQDICALTGTKWMGAAYGTANELNEAEGNAALMSYAFELGKTLV